MELGDNNEIAMTIAKFCMLLIIGLIILSSVVTNSNVQQNNRVALPFSGQPADGDILTLDDFVFEFDNNGGVVAGHISVTIGATIDDTKINLNAAIQANTNYVVT